LRELIAFHYVYLIVDFFFDLKIDLNAAKLNGINIKNDIQVA
jgi:hypothetical protein